MKYHIKPLGMTKTQAFRQDFHRYDLFLYPWRLIKHFSGTSHHLAKLGGHSHRCSGDILVLVCHVFLQDHVTKR